MKRIFLLLFAVIVFTDLKAQQDPHYSHFMFNQAGYNPAYCGIEGVINATLLYRNQWLGLEGAPKTMMLTADMPVTVLGRASGVGVTMESDNIGFEKNFTAKLTKKLEDFIRENPEQWVWFHERWKTKQK